MKIKKFCKVYILVLAISMMGLNSFSLANDQPFSDVGRDHWAYSYIERASKDKIINGYSDGTFKPESPIKRCEWAKIIFTMENLEIDKMAATVIDLGTDMDHSSWYAFMMLEVKDYLIPEVDNSEPESYWIFYPERYATRAEVAASLGRIKMEKSYDASDEGLNQFSDNDKIPGEHRSPITVAVNSGIINGYQDGSFRPLEYVTRAEAVAMLYRAYDSKDVSKEDGPTPYSLYNRKIKEYSDAITMGRDVFDKKYENTGDESINTLMVQYVYNYDISLSYALYDVNKDDVYELLFSDGDSVIDIYTICDDTLIKLFPDCCFGDRQRLYFLTDGTLFTEGADSAFSSTVELFVIQDGNKVVCKDVYFYDSSEDELEYDPSFKKLSVDEYIEITDSLMNKSAFKYASWNGLVE